MSNTSTDQEKPKGNPNPSPDTRFGGKKANLQSPGGWKSENTISYQYRRFLNMTPVKLKEFSKIPEGERTVAMDIAYAQVIQSQKSLLHAKEVTDRTEGKAQQFIDMTTGGEPMKALVQFMDSDADDKDTAS